MSSNSVCAICIRVLLFTINLVLCIGSLVLIAYLIWIRCDARYEADVKEVLQLHAVEETKRIIGIYTTVTFWVLIGVSILVFFVGLVGCCGSVFENRCLLGIYFSFILILFLIELGIGIFIIVYRPRIRDELNRYVAEAYFNNGNNIYTDEVAIMEKRFQCCGLDNSIMPRCQQQQQQQQFQQFQPLLQTCGTAVWNRVDNILMISGIITIIVLCIEGLAMILCCIVVVSGGRRHRTVVVPDQM